MYLEVIFNLVHKLLAWNLYCACLTCSHYANEFII